MIKWFKRNQDLSSKNETENLNGQIQALNETATEVTEPPLEEELVQTKAGIFTRFKKGLSKTRHQLGEGIGRLLLGKKEISKDLLEELETLLITADIGIHTTHVLINQLTQGLERKQLTDGDAVYQALKSHLQQLLGEHTPPWPEQSHQISPLVILVVGVNGAGKTTTIGKLAKQFQQQGKKVMLAAGDTFRAAAVEQLHVWGERNDVAVIAQHTGADSASVIFDAFQAAKARKMDVLIADTAGRLHTQNNLMEELKKVKKVLKKIDPQAPHEILLILDASIGQNALNQAKQFHEAMDVTGIIMTKLDGTAKGGILFAIAHDLGIPFRFIGVGEGIDDLRPFDAAQFVGAIFNDDHI